MHLIQKIPPIIDKVILAINYKKEMIESYFQERQDEIQPEIVFAEEREPLGTGGAIKNCEKEISGTFIVFNGDVIDSLNVQHMINYHMNRNGIGSISVWKVSDPTRFGIIGFSNQGKITRFLEKPQPHEIFSNYINAGTYVLEPEILDHIEIGRMVSIEREVYPFILDKNLYAFSFTGYWEDAGTRHDYLNATRKIMDYQHIEAEIGAGSIIHPEAKLLPPIVIGNNCMISNCILGPYAVIGHRTRLERDVRIENSSLLENVVVEKEAVIQNSIIARGQEIGEQEIVEDTIRAKQ